MLGMESGECLPVAKLKIGVVESGRDCAAQQCPVSAGYQAATLPDAGWYDVLRLMAGGEIVADDDDTRADVRT